MSQYKIKGYKSHIQKSAAFLQASNEQCNFKIKNSIPFIIATTKKAVLRYKSNSIYNLYIIKHLKEIKDLNKWKVIHGLYISIIKV